MENISEVSLKCLDVFLCFHIERKCSKKVVKLIAMRRMKTVSRDPQTGESLNLVFKSTSTVKMKPNV